MKFSLLLTTSTLLLLTSCAQFSHSTKVTKSIGEFDFEPYKALGLKSPMLEDLIKKVKESKDSKLLSYLARDLYLKGNDASVRGNAQLAVYYFKNALELNPQDLFIQRKFSYDLIRVGDITKAREILENIYSKTSPRDEVVGQLLGSVYASLEQKEKAISIYKDLIALNPYSEENCMYLGRLLASDKKYDEVHELFAKCNSSEDKYPSLYFYLGKIEYDKKDRKKARKFFEQALKVDPTYTQGALGIGALYEEKEEFGKALSYYQKFVSNEANYYDVQILNRIVTIMLSLEENKKVIPYAERLVSTENADLNIKVRLGLLYSDEQRFDDAISIFKSILAEVPESDKIQYYLGALYQQLNNFDVAISHYNQIKADSPLFGEAGLQIGQMLSLMASDSFSRGQLKPVEKFSKFIEERTKQIPELAVELNMMKATFYEETQQLDKALEVLDKVKNHKSFSDNHRYYFASILERVGKHVQARDYIKEILARDEDNAHALNFLGYSYVEKNENMDEAYRLISKAVALSPEDGYIRDSLAWYFFKVGKYEEALVEAIKAYDLVSNDPTITKHLGLIYHELSHFDKAHHYLTQVLTLTQAVAERDDVLKLLSEIQSKRAPASKD